MVSDIRMTLAVARVLREFLAEPTQAQYGYSLMRRTGYPSGKLYPILYRLVHAGWLTRTTEAIDPAEAGRPARSMYQLTSDGAEAARRELAVLSQSLSLLAAVRLQPRTEGGAA